MRYWLFTKTGYRYMVINAKMLYQYRESDFLYLRTLSCLAVPISLAGLTIKTTFFFCDLGGAQKRSRDMIVS